MLTVVIRVLKRPTVALIAVFLAGMADSAAQVKPGLSATPSPAAATHQLVSQKQPSTTATSPAACNALGNTAAAHPGNHTVSLSWNASVPATSSSRDAVIGYIVYRSTKPHDTKALPINIQRLVDTKCVDTQVVPGETYYYVTRAVSARGALSGPSNEVRVKVPPYTPASTE